MQEHDYANGEGEAQHKASAEVAAMLQGRSALLTIPEIRSIVLAFLDSPSLLAAARVSRAWNESAIPILWWKLDAPRLSPLFFEQVRLHGHHVQQLDLVLDTSNGGHVIAPTELTWMLMATPHLRFLDIYLSHGGSAETTSSMIKIIAHAAASHLERLSLAIGRICAEDAQLLFSSLVSIKKLKLIRCASKLVLNAIAKAQLHLPTNLTSFSTTPLLPRRISTTPEADLVQTQHYDDAALANLAQSLPDLKELSIVGSANITSLGLGALAQHCNVLTKLDLQCCETIDSLGFQTLIEASPSLTHIWLGHTRANDQLLSSLSTPTRASNLQVLSIARCWDMTSLGIMHIVRSCQNIRTLDFSQCPLVKLDIFAEPAWECRKLQRLFMRGISQVEHSETVAGQSQDFVSFRQPQAAALEGLSDMYRQLGGLRQLQELDIGGLPFNLRVLAAGRVNLEALTKLRVLHVLNLAEPLTWQEVTWLALRLRGLRTLELDAFRGNEQVLRELMEINPDVTIEVVNRPPSVDVTGVDHQNIGPGPLPDAADPNWANDGPNDGPDNTGDGSDDNNDGSDDNNDSSDNNMHAMGSFDDQSDSGGHDENEHTDQSISYSDAHAIESDTDFDREEERRLIMEEREERQLLAEEARQNNEVEQRLLAEEARQDSELEHQLGNDDDSESEFDREEEDDRWGKRLASVSSSSQEDELEAEDDGSHQDSSGCSDSSEENVNRDGDGSISSVGLRWIQSIDNDYSDESDDDHPQSVHDWESTDDVDKSSECYINSDEDEHDDGYDSLDDHDNMGNGGMSSNSEECVSEDNDSRNSVDEVHDSEGSDDNFYHKDAYDYDSEEHDSDF